MSHCTLITDASFHAAGVAGWAAWAKADGRDSRRWEGQIRATWVTTNNEAELAAIVLGLRHVVEYAPGHAVLVQSDSWRSLALLCRETGAVNVPVPGDRGLHVAGTQIRRELSYADERLCSSVRVLCENVPRLMVRHVRGHTNARNAGRHRTNCVCDEAAKSQMRALRDAMGLVPCAPPPRRAVQGVLL